LTAFVKANSPDCLLELLSVTVQFDALKAVDRLSLKVAEGERRAIIGPNGAGKTTLFNAITGALFPSSGDIILGGRRITRMPPNRRAHLGIARTFQITNLFSRLSVIENMRLAARGASRTKFSMFGSDALNAFQTGEVWNALTAARLLEREEIVVGELSYGEQRQLELAMALATRPKLLLLDEPAAGLSPAERSILGEIIRNLHRSITVILIEHDMDLALGLVDFVTVMHNGQIIAEDRPAKIRGNPTVQDVYLGHPHRAAT